MEGLFERDVEELVVISVAGEKILLRQSIHFG